jgi:hypothetical protein
MRSIYSRRIHFEQLESRNMLAVAIPGDYDQSGVVDNDDFTVWRANFGEFAELADGQPDGNGDGFVDAADYVVWRKNLGRVAPPNAPQEVSAAAVGATSIRVDWQAASGATSYAVQRREPGNEFTTIAPSVVTTTYTDNTATADTLYEYRVVAQNTHGSSPASQGDEARANQPDLTAFRPQSVQDPNNPVNRAIYDRPTDGGFPGGFPKRPVLEIDEFSATLGPGIRMNTDPDPVVGGISTENDLIEVKIDRLPGQGDLILQRSGALVLYYDYDKDTPVPMQNASNTEPLQFAGNSATVFVEWASPEHGTDILSLLNGTTFAVLDSVRFHSFRSIVTVFGGKGQDARDTDGDGRISDPRDGGDPNDPNTNIEGIFEIAQDLYESGWDVLAFSTPDAAPPIDQVIGVAYDEIVNAITYQAVGNPFDFGGGVAVMGYSWGGGAAHDLIERLWDDFDYNVTYGVFLDAVVYGTRLPPIAQNDWPNEVFYLLNIYQENIFLGGEPIDPNDVTPGAMLEDIDTTTAPGFPGNLNHSNIDDDPQVQARIRLRLGQLMFR